jgi:LPXTG-motif cell wall-anchored protein
MNRTLKRVLALTGSVALGLAGAVTFASAAQAHHTVLEGSSACAEDGWTVTWKVSDWTDDPNNPGWITTITGGEGLEGDIVEGAELPAPGTAPLESTQTFDLGVTEVTLQVAGKWDNEQTNSGTPVTVYQPAGGCEVEGPEEPVTQIGSETDCVGIYVWASNENAEALQEFTFVGSDGEEVSGTPEVGDEFWHYFLMEEAETGLSVEVYAGEELVDTIEWTGNALCEYVAVEADCEGLIFTLTVPADGETTTFELVTSLNQDESESITLNPGETETRTYKAVSGEDLWVDYYIETPKDATAGGVQWIPCEEETPSESPSAAPQLPTTGSSLSIMIGSAAALILAAAAIFLIMRRRRAAQDW